MRIPLWALIVLLVCVVGGGYGLYALHEENKALHKEVEHLSHIVAERPVELSTFMTSYERFLGKLHAAGAAGNWPLAAFYYEELEETAEQLEKLGLTDDGVPVSQMMRPNLIEPLEAVEAAIEKQDGAAFHAALAQVVTQCNSCHAAAGKPYIRFTLPTPTQAPHQVFSLP